MKKEIPEQFQKLRYERNMFSKLKEQTITDKNLNGIKYRKSGLKSCELEGLANSLNNAIYEDDKRYTEARLLDSVQDFLEDKMFAKNSYVLTRDGKAYEIKLSIKGCILNTRKTYQDKKQKIDVLIEDENISGKKFFEKPAYAFYKFQSDSLEKKITYFEILEIQGKINQEKEKKEKLLMQKQEPVKISKNTTKIPLNINPTITDSITRTQYLY